MNSKEFKTRKKKERMKEINEREKKTKQGI